MIILFTPIDVSTANLFVKFKLFITIIWDSITQVPDDTFNQY